MKKSPLSDKQLENLLTQMPKIKDDRDPRDIYQNIASKVEKRKKSTWIYPGIAAAAVLFLAFILSSGIFLGNQTFDESEDEKSVSQMDQEIQKNASTDTGLRNSSLEMGAKKNADSMTSENFLADQVGTSEGLSAVYPNEAEGKEVLVFAIPDKNGQFLVPVSVINSSQTGNSWFDQFTEMMPKLEEEKWGLSEFYPIDGHWVYDQSTKTLKMSVSKNHLYKEGSAMSPLVLKAMAQNFSKLGIRKVKYFTDTHSGIDFGNRGIITEEKIIKTANKNRAYLFYFTDSQPTPYLVPTEKEYSTIQEALKAMTSNQPFGLQASIQPGYFEHFKVFESNDNMQLKIRWSSEKNLDEQFLPSLEAILMTAKDFGFLTVKIEGAGIEKIGPFDLNEELELPLAPNKKDIP